MALITYNGLVDLVKRGVISDVDQDRINGASIDVTLGNFIQVESTGNYNRIVDVDLAKKERPDMYEVDLERMGYYVLHPGEFILAQTREIFNLPNHIAIEYKLKSSLARSGLGHLLAGWGDPGWNGSVLTLELKNSLRYHSLILTPGMPIGQVVFWHGESVPNSASYKTRGQYNNDIKTQPSKGIK